MKTFTAALHDVTSINNFLAHLVLSDDFPEKPPIREPGEKPFKGDPSRKPSEPHKPGQEPGLPPMEVPPGKSPGKEIPPRM